MAIGVGTRVDQPVQMNVSDLWQRELEGDMGAIERLYRVRQEIPTLFDTSHLSGPENVGRSVLKVQFGLPSRPGGEACVNRANGGETQRLDINDDVQSRGTSGTVRPVQQTGENIPEGNLGAEASNETKGDLGSRIVSRHAHAAEQLAWGRMISHHPRVRKLVRQLLTHGDRDLVLGVSRPASDGDRSNLTVTTTDGWRRAAGG